MKLNKLVTTLGLAAVLAAGVGIAVSANQSAKTAKADATFAANTNIYLAGKGDITVTGCTLNAWVWYTTGGSHWETFDYDDLSGYYMITLDSAATGLTFARSSSRPADDSSTWGDAGTIYNQTDMGFVSDKNWIWPTSWGSGLDINCEWRYIHYHIGGSFNSWVMNSDTYRMADTFDDDGHHQTFISLTTTTADVVLKAATLYNGTDVMNYYGSLESGYNTEYVGNDASGNIQLKKAGSYEIYLKSDRKVWVQISSASEADLYAQSFLSAITCTDNSVTFAISVWNKIGDAQTSMEYKYTQLTQGAKNVLKDASANPNGSNVEKCVARYDRILNKYGSGTGDNQYHDFMGRGAGSSGAIVRSILTNNINNSGVTLICIIAASTIVAVGAYFFIRRKHEK